MKIQRPIQPRHTQLAQGKVTYLNYRSMHIWPPTKLDYILLKLFIWLHIHHNIWSFWINASHFEIDAWNFWHFNLMNKPLDFWGIKHFHKSRFPFPSQILVCTMAFPAHYLFLFWDLHLLSSLSKKNKRVERYIGTSLCKSQDQ